MLTIETRKGKYIHNMLKDVKEFVDNKYSLDILQCVYVDEKGISACNLTDGKRITRLWDHSIKVTGKAHALIPYEVLRNITGAAKTVRGIKAYGLANDRVIIKIQSIPYRIGKHGYSYVMGKPPYIQIKSGKFNAKLVTENPTDYPVVRITPQPVTEIVTDETLDEAAD